MSKRLVFGAVCACALVAQLAQATPYIPKQGSDVIERLPRRNDPAQQELQRLRAQLATNPRDITLATTAARQYIAIARRETDPRYFGYAQAALAPWWGMAAPPPQVRLLRATLLQSTHRFPEAMRDLDAIVEAEPQNPQAWLTRATVQTVRGDYEGATTSCARLSNLSSDLVSVTCISSVGAMTGRALPSERLLQTTLERNPQEDAGMQVWVLTLMAEIAERRGDYRAAEQRYQRALALDPKDSYLIGAYADFLLDRKRPDDVLKLVKDQGRIDGLLLRRALALTQLPSRAADLRNADAELNARFNAAMQRGDTVHQREQARYELHVRGNTRAALALAQKNWAVQKESADMRVLLEAALKANDPAAAEPVLKWVATHKVEDVAVQRLARQIKGDA
ncbi:tetratricopeptide repeat protein [Massilia sp. PAMC28688]|uniref:tetratricopeptide repeat protein n=1 Tax=Massilia sp. PAMC28688 TaxID=2861283 RepID=UPI001C636CB5|nr:tetratricopeptide repeat protein [Massilia sp. PAMC28688]QYF91698.1 tetratricopeptide repeat protein [Massilia sp. PAMC28688]